MKLLDLLKSLNNGATINPDINLEPDIGSRLDTPDAVSDNRKRLLTELTSIAELLDADQVAPEPSTTAAATSHEKNLLDIEHIFGERDELNTADDVFIQTTSSPLQFMPVENAAPTHNGRQQIIASLLDELLPIFETALAQRLNQLDSTTLQQWHQTLLETAETYSPTSK